LAGAADRRSPTSLVWVELELGLIELGLIELGLIELGEERLLVLDSYAVDLPAEDAGIESSITAINQAVAEIFGRVLAVARRSAVALGLAPLGTRSRRVGSSDAGRRFAVQV
jgi:hypothetical protein